MPRVSRIAVSVVLLISAARAQPSASPATPPAQVEPPLPELPKPPARSLRAPNPNELQALDELLGRLRGGDPAARQTAESSLDRIDPSLVPAIAERLRRLSEAADKPEMKAALLTLRRQARDEAGEQEPTSSTLGHDSLDLLLSHPEPDRESWKNLVSVLGMGRMLVGVGTVEAARELIGIYVRFGEFLRVQTQRNLEQLGDRAIAPLIEATQHQAPKIADWAKHRLQLLGKSNPAEVVQIDTPGVLADVLRAYGGTRDPDVARLVISFTNSEHAEVRRAAREAVTLLGEVANWPLRDTYEKLIGKRAFREWSWERCARELYREFDRARLVNVYLAYTAGVAAQKRGAFDEMRHKFDEVLTQDPGFDDSAELVQGYFEYAKHAASKDPNQAIEALERAERLSDDGALRHRIQSLRLTLDGERLLATGIADPILFRRAALLDPDNQQAKDDIARVERGPGATPSALNRYAAAIVIGVLTLFATIFLLRLPPGGPKPPEGAAKDPVGS